MQNNNDLDALAHIVAYNQIREYEDNELIESLFKLIAGNPKL
jgi:hypothetical protein